MVYVLIETYPYECSDVLGLYSTKDKAEVAKDVAIKKDDTNGYNCFDIEEFEVK